MSVLLIRHAVARSRHAWNDDDELRPLNKRGSEQAAGLVDQLADYPVTEVRSSPAVRCVDTVAPLAAARGLKVAVDRALFEGSSSAAIKLVRRLIGSRADIALCSHGDVIPDVLDALGFDCDRCAKGSTWAIDAERALYLPPMG